MLRHFLKKVIISNIDFYSNKSLKFLYDYTHEFYGSTCSVMNEYRKHAHVPIALNGNCLKSFPQFKPYVRVGYMTSRKINSRLLYKKIKK